MSAAEVTGIVRQLDGAGFTAWVDGGWGVDALLGVATREHSDLDLVILMPELPGVRQLLWESGYRMVVRDWLPTALALADALGRQVDLHPVTPEAGGGGCQALPAGQSFRYPPPVPGVIDGQPVWCVDAQTQVGCHLGYPPTAKDLLDMRRLGDRLGVNLPADLRG